MDLCFRFYVNAFLNFSSATRGDSSMWDWAFDIEITLTNWLLLRASWNFPGCNFALPVNTVATLLVRATVLKYMKLCSVSSLVLVRAQFCLLLVYLRHSYVPVSSNLSSPSSQVKPLPPPTRHCDILERLSLCPLVFHLALLGINHQLSSVCASRPSSVFKLWSFLASSSSLDLSGACWTSKMS